MGEGQSVWSRSRSLLMVALGLVLGAGLELASQRLSRPAELLVGPSNSDEVRYSTVIEGTRRAVDLSAVGYRMSGCTTIELSVEDWMYCIDLDCDGWSDDVTISLDGAARTIDSCRSLPGPLSRLLGGEVVHRYSE